MATASVPDHLTDAARWTVPVPDYAALQGVVGGAALSNQTVCKDAVTAQSTRSPLVVLFVVQGDKSSRSNRCYLSTTVGLISQNNLRMVTAVTVDIKSRCQQLFITTKIMKAKS